MQEDDRKCQTDKVRLEVAEVAAGTGAEARPGRRVAVHYTGWLFHPDKPRTTGGSSTAPASGASRYEFTIGQGEVIPGWDQGISGMKVGAKRTLVIPAEPRLRPQRDAAGHSRQCDPRVRRGAHGRQVAAVSAASRSDHGNRRLKVPPKI